MSREWQRSVEAFHRACNLTVGETIEMRDTWLAVQLNLEEAVEHAVAGVGLWEAKALLLKAWEKAFHSVAAGKLRERDLEHYVDGGGDNIVTVLGSMVRCGVDMAPIMDLINAANIAKASGPKDENGKQLKPPGWQPPDIAGEIERQRQNGARLKAIEEYETPEPWQRDPFVRPIKEEEP